MSSKPTTVAEYLAALPEDRRQALEALRKTIRANLDKDLEEGMQYGMIGYYVPHSVFPAGYHCDPKQPLPFAGLASQKNHMSMYFMALYAHGDSENELTTSFQEAWKKTGKKLDMGKACIRFKKLEDLPLDVLAQAFKRMTVKQYIRAYEHGLGTFGTANATRAKKKAPAKKASTKPAKTVKKAAKKAAAKPRSARA
jgi:hypothetical protein